MTIEEQIQKIKDQTYKKWLNPRDEKFLDAYHFEEIFRSEIEGKKFDDRVKELIEQGYNVKGGYFATSVRGYHRREIFYKKDKK